MIRSKIAFVLVTLLIVSGRAVADGNAAVWYQKASADLDRFSDEDWQTIADYVEAGGGPPPADVRDLLAQAGPIFATTARGARQDGSDFGLDYSEGFELQLPHLHQMRQISRLMSAEVYRAMNDGDSARAASTVSSMYRMSEHMGNDRTLISALVGQSIYAMGDATAQAGFDRAMFNAGDADAMLSAMGRFDEQDPFGVIDAVAGEQAIVGDYLVDRFGSLEQREGMFDGMPWVDADNPASQALQSMDDGDFDVAIGQYDELMDQVVTVFMDDDPDRSAAALKEIGEAVEAGAYGPIAQIFVPAWGKVHDMMHKARDMVASRKAMLEGLASGAVDPIDEANAAPYYARAFELMAALSDEDRSLALGADPIDDEDARSRVDEILDYLHEGGTKKRCSFEMIRGPLDPGFCPPDLAGFRNAFRLVHADIERALARGDTAAAVSGLGVCFGMITHLETDDLIVSALLAHRTFDLTCAIAWRLDETNQVDLLDSVSRISRKDPFGYLASIQAARQRTEWPIHRRRSFEESSDEDHERAMEEVGRWTGDQRLYFAVVIDTMTRAGLDDAEAADPVAGLDDVLDQSAVELARDEVGLVAPMIADFDYAIFDGRAIPVIGRVDERRFTARRDLRAALNRLRDLEEKQESADDAGESIE